MKTQKEIIGTIEIRKGALKGKVFNYDAETIHGFFVRYQYGNMIFTTYIPYKDAKVITYDKNIQNII